MDALFFIQVGLGIISTLLLLLWKQIGSKLEDLSRHDVSIDHRLTQIEIALARLEERQRLQHD